MSWATADERGSILGMRIMIWCLRRLGRRAAGILSQPVILYFFLTGGRARAASRRYLQRVASIPEGRSALGRSPDLWASWMHFQTFGRSLLDRACIWSGLGDRYHIEFPARAELERLQSSGRGAILLGAHLGSFDILRALASKKSIPVHLLMFQANALKINAVLKSIDPGMEVRAIHVEPGSIQPILDLKACLDRGEFVAVLGDRAELASKKRIARTPFLGSEASFSLGPLWIAHLLECPVYLIFALQRGRDSYEICFERFAERIVLDRERREGDLEVWLERYVRRLEAHCLTAPLQWFNFYDFWRDDGPGEVVSRIGTVCGSDLPDGQTAGG